MAGHLDMLAALRLFDRGRTVPGRKYTALQRAGWIRVKGHGPGSKPILTEAGRVALAAPPGGGSVTTPEESVMAHRIEHPLAGRIVVPNSGLAFGERVIVVGWLSAHAAPSADRMVLVRDRTGHRPMPAHDLPAYDPAPIGIIS